MELNQDAGKVGWTGTGGLDRRKGCESPCTPRLLWLTAGQMTESSEQWTESRQRCGRRQLLRGPNRTLSGRRNQTCAGRKEPVTSCSSDKKALTLPEEAGLVIHGVENSSSSQAVKNTRSLLKGSDGLKQKLGGASLCSRVII